MGLLTSTQTATLVRDSMAYSFLVYRYRDYLPSGRYVEMMELRREINHLLNLLEGRPWDFRVEATAAFPHAERCANPVERRYRRSPESANTPRRDGVYSWTLRGVVYNPLA